MGATLNWVAPIFFILHRSLGQICKIISKEFGCFDNEFYRKKEYDIDELKEILENTKINKETIMEVNLDGQAI